MATGTDEMTVPRRIEGSDEHASGLDAIARFVLSQIDGRTTAADIADATMLDPSQVDAMLVSFARKGLVHYGAPTPVAEAATPTPVPAGHGSGDARVDSVFVALMDATHYELLGVDPAADKALVKRAYFVLSKEFHPDSSPYRKIPAIRPRLETIFRRLTDAHDALSRPKRRDAYDAELASAKKAPYARRLHPPIELPKSVEIELPPETNATPTTPVAPPMAAAPVAAVPTPGPAPAAPPRPPLAGTPSAASIRMPSATTPGAAPRPAGIRAPTVPGQTTSSAGAAPRAASPLPPTPPRPPAASPAPTAPRPPVASPAPAAAATAASAADRQRSLLRALHGASQVTRPVDKATQYEEQGAASEASGDLKAALSFYRVAAQLSPDREDIRQKVVSVDKKLAESEAGANREKAKLEEGAKRYETAAIAWSRVCLGVPHDVDAHAGAARCLLAANLDLRQARDFAQRAVDLAPNRVELRIVLIRVYQAAGMRLNARREVEVAAKLDPSNQLVKNLQRELE